MSQVGSFTVQDGSGVSVRNGINAVFQALATCNAGVAPPSAPVQGELWLDTNVSPRQLNYWDDALGVWVQLTGAPTELLDVTLAAGVTNNLQLGSQYGFVDVSIPGPASITGIQAGFDGQELIVTNTSVSLLQLVSLSNLSLANAQIRVPAPGITLVQFESLQLKYSAQIGLWIGVP